MFHYEEYTISDDAMVAAVVNGNKSLTESGILEELNKVCAERGVEVDWSFGGGFPKMFMLKRPIKVTAKRPVKKKVDTTKK